MDSSDVLAGAVSLPVVIALSQFEPAAGLAAGFALFLAVRGALPLARRAPSLLRTRRITPRFPLLPRS